MRRLSHFSDSQSCHHDDEVRGISTRDKEIKNTSVHHFYQVRIEIKQNVKCSLFSLTIFIFLFLGTFDEQSQREREREIYIEREILISVKNNQKYKYKIFF